jgi:hypothetical protein
MTGDRSSPRDVQARRPAEAEETTRRLAEAADRLSDALAADDDQPALDFPIRTGASP